MGSISGRGLAEVPEKTEDNREMLSQGTRCLGQLEPGTCQVRHSLRARNGLIRPAR
jgi:hypothetical protein